MLHFHTVTLRDKDWIDAVVARENSRSADFNFGNIYLWDKQYRQLVAPCGERMITKLRYGGVPMFAFPIGGGELAPVMDALREFAALRGYPLCIRGITEENRALLETVCPGEFTFTEDTNCFDYL